MSKKHDKKMQEKTPRHPLPASGEARHDRIPESDEREKGRGEDDARVVQPAADPVNPDGKHYSSDTKE